MKNWQISVSVENADQATIDRIVAALEEALIEAEVHMLITVKEDEEQPEEAPLELAEACC